MKSSQRDVSHSISTLLMPGSVVSKSKADDHNYREEGKRKTPARSKFSVRPTPQRQSHLQV